MAVVRAMRRKKKKVGSGSNRSKSGPASRTPSPKIVESASDLNHDDELGNPLVPGHVSQVEKFRLVGKILRVKLNFKITYFKNTYFLYLKNTIKSSFYKTLFQ